MKILVTGGAGFIGTHLCRNLVTSGYHVRSLDISSPITKIDEVEYIEGNVLDVKCLRQALTNIDVVYHFAATVSVPLCQMYPLSSYENNLTSTIIILEELKNLQKKSSKPIKFFFSSSSAVYGNCEEKEIPSVEDQRLPMPSSHYGIQKLASEHAIKVFHQQTGIACLSFRFFNVFGIGQNPNSPYTGVITIFMKHLLQNEPLKIFGSGNQYRDFISVKDLVKACALALKADEKWCDGSAINIGSGCKTTILELTKILGQVARVSPQVLMQHHRAGDVVYSLAELSKAKSILKWQPDTLLFNGLLELWDNFNGQSQNAILVKSPSPFIEKTDPISH